MTITEIQEEIIEEFEMFDEWMDKYEYLIEQAKTIPILQSEHKVAQNLINGCQSRVWLNAEITEGKINFSADSDAIITKGIVALLIRILDARTPSEILETELFFIDKIGLSENLSPTRSNGLMSMIKQMKLYALAFKTKSNQS